MPASPTAWTSVICPLEITTRTCTSPKRLGKSEPVKVPLVAVGADGDGDGGGVAEGVLADCEGDGLAGLPGPWVGDAGASAVNWWAVAL